MNLNPHGLQHIVGNLHNFIQHRPNTAKRLRPEKDDSLYFPPNGVPTTHTFQNNKKKVSRCTNLLKHLSDTSCIENGFTVTSRGSKPPKAKISDGTHKHHKHMIRCSGHGCTGYKNPTKKQKHETKAANTCSDKYKFESPIFHDASMGHLYVHTNDGGHFQHNGHSFALCEHTKDSLNNIARLSLDLAIKLIEKNILHNVLNTIIEVQSRRLFTSDSLKQLQHVVLNKKTSENERGKCRWLPQKNNGQQ